MNDRISVSSARLLVATIIGVCVSFLLATLFEQFRASDIDRRVNQIVGNSSPSVEHLSRARSALTRVMSEVNSVDPGTPASERESARRRAMDDEGDAEAAIQSYLLFPLFPSEAQMADQVKANIPGLRPALEQVFDGTPVGERRLFAENLRTVRERVQGLDHALERNLDFNAVESQRLGLEISRIRMESLAIVIVLDLMSISLAIAAAILATRIMRGSVRTLEAQTVELAAFSSRVAHDLKGPLSSILLVLDLGDRELTDEKRRELRARVRGSIYMMTSIIDGLLDFAQSGARPLVKASDLSAVVDTVTSLVQDQARSQDIELVVEPFPRPMFVACDEGSLASAVSNLLRNAVKYVSLGQDPRHKIFVRVKRVADRVRFEVEDNGPGVRTEDQDRIFKPYVRAETSVPGLGLGLATVSRVVEARGGRVGVSSEPRKGSTFWFELPGSGWKADEAKRTA